MAVVESTPPAYRAVVRIRFHTPEHAAMAATSLSVDPELQPSKAFKAFSTEGHTLVITLGATELRVLRVVVSSVFDMATVVARTMREFATV